MSETSQREGAAGATLAGTLSMEFNSEYERSAGSSSRTPTTVPVIKDAIVRPTQTQLPAGSDVRGEGMSTDVVQAPLSKLWELDRLEMEKQREELRSVRGELRNVRAGEHSRYREEKAANLQLQKAIAELISNADEEGDAFTLDTLLRAVEAGRERSVSPRVSQSKEEQQRLLVMRHRQNKAIVSVAAAALLSAGLVELARRTKLDLQVRRATASMLTGCRSAAVIHMSWLLVPFCRTAKWLARGRSLNGRQASSGPSTSPGSTASVAAAARAASAQTIQQTIMTGYNSGLHRSRRSWAKPWTLFKSNAQRQVSSPPPLPPPLGITPAGTPQLTRPQPQGFNPLYISSSSPQLQALTFYEYQYPLMGRHSLDPTLMPSVPSPGTRPGPAAPPPAAPVGEGQPVQMMRTSSSEGQMLAYVQGAARSAPESPTHASRSLLAPTKPGFVHRTIKADHLTAPTNVSVGWQSRYGLAPPFQTAGAQASNHDAGAEGKTPAAAFSDLSLAPETESVANGVSFRMIVENAAELPAAESRADKSSGKGQHSFDYTFQKHQEGLQPLQMPRTAVR